MKTEQIIKTLQKYNDWRRARGKWDVDTFNDGESFFDGVTAHEIGLTIDAAIERLKELELTVARYDRLYDVEANEEVEQKYRKEIRQLARERDEARDEAETVRALYKNSTVKAGAFPWEKENRQL